MTLSQPTIKLNNGIEIPQIGLGTWQSKPNEVATAVAAALKEGYRHIDGAWAYGNEAEVGQGIKDSGVPRSEIFITSKVWSTYHNRVEECLDQTLKSLGTDYVDLLLMHWPIPLNPNGNHPLFPTRPDGSRDLALDWPLEKTWKQLEAVYKAGKAKAIGVSNCSELKLNEILANAEVIPAVNQLELHVYNPQHKLLAFLKSKGIVAQAYSPLGSTNSPLFTDPDVVAIAERDGVSPSTVLLSYLLAKDIVILPKSVTPSRIADNLHKTLAYKIAPADVELLDTLAGEKGRQKRFITPPWGTVVGFEDWYEAAVQGQK